MNLNELENILFKKFQEFLTDRAIEMPDDLSIQKRILDVEDLDSLDVTELFINFEEELGIEFPDKFQDFEAMKSISSIAKYIEANYQIGGNRVETL
ncbi:acyl carrier protein [Bacillus sp. Marseille-Q3570]|uniref:acyl carrier protein n=1 Tax=Bacillus sp. Marseille-Q3570 TaxID=2963522 RepID=UPI0021B74282|nr:phosphopantetheine-binding protein [Bacillus sp. Marseille-Q3570]